MKLAVIAIGKPGRGPEAVLAADYAERATLAVGPWVLARSSWSIWNRASRARPPRPS